MHNTYYAYIRVSTAKQALQSSSLTEQRRAIEYYATEHSLHISRWFQEVESATKGRRVVFRSLIAQLAQSKAVGLIMHKIDRGTRSLKDWADVADLMDAGVDVRFAHDDLDLKTRGGRLTADIQAVIAADYIRNLREEVRKGIMGRLHEGIYPFGAPRGYIDTGKGRVKRPDPVVAPLIVEAFRQYATGTFTLKALTEKMAVLGLLTPDGDPITPSSLSKILRCRFYAGEYVVRGITYQGQHQPLVSRDLFNQVQRILKRRKNRKRIRHSFTYSRRLTCNTCGHFLIGETQKGYVYYRCHQCKGICIREDRIVREQQKQKPFKIVSSIEPELQPYSEFDSPKGSNFLTENYDFHVENMA